MQIEEESAERYRQFVPIPRSTEDIALFLHEEM